MRGKLEPTEQTYYLLNENAKIVNSGAKSLEEGVEDIF